MVSGDAQAMDSAPVKANASMDSLKLKQAGEPANMQVVNEENEPAGKQDKNNRSEQYITAPDHQLRKLEKRQENLRESPGSIGGHHDKAQLLSNKTHYSPTDPDARISVKPGKTRRLNYHCSLTVDTGEGVISHVQADFADSRDSQNLPAITLRLQRRLTDNELRMQDLLADGAFSNGSNYAFLEQQKVTGWIPVFGKYKPEIEGFPYDPEKDRFTCAAGKALPFKTYDTTADGGLLKIYRADYQDCKNCPLKASCVPRSKCRQITRTAYDPEYKRALERQQSRMGKRMKRIRQSTVEPVFGSLVNYYGMSKVGVKGKAGAHKVMLMATIAFNLRKYMKFKPVKVKSMAIALERGLTQPFTGFVLFLILLFTNKNTKNQAPAYLT